MAVKQNKCPARYIINIRLESEDCTGGISINTDKAVDKKYQKEIFKTLLQLELNAQQLEARLSGVRWNLFEEWEDDHVAYDKLDGVLAFKENGKK